MRTFRLVTHGIGCLLLLTASSCVDNAKLKRFDCATPGACAPAGETGGGQGGVGPMTGGGGGGEVTGPRLELLAGSLGGLGNLDGVGQQARLSYPFGVAIDSAGTVFFSEPASHAIRKMTREGQVSLVAGKIGVSGKVDGAGAEARFSGPQGLAVAADNTLLVADTENHAIRKISTAGVVTTLAGTLGVAGAENGIGTSARLNRPTGLAVLGNFVYVTEFANRIIRRISLEGQVDILAGTPGMPEYKDGPSAVARFLEPSGIAALSEPGADAFLVVRDVSALRRVNLDGTVSFLAGSPTESGSIDGTGSNARLSIFFGACTTGPDGTVLFTDPAGHSIRRVSGGGKVTTLSGSSLESGQIDGAAKDARFDTPVGIGVSPEGQVFIADQRNHSLRQLDIAKQTVSTVAGLPRVFGISDGTGGAAEFWNIVDSVWVPERGLVVTDRGGANGFRLVTTSGTVATLENKSSGGPLTSLDGIYGVAVGGDSLYWTESLNLSESPMPTPLNRGVVRQRSREGLVETVAGSTELLGATDGPSGMALFRGPTGIAVDAAGVIFVADTNNHTIRRIGLDRVVSTFAGQAGLFGLANGLGAAARFAFPSGLAFDREGNLLVVDSGNHSIRKVTPSGSVSTFVGSSGAPGAVDGPRLVSRFSSPSDVAVAADGTMFVADTGNHSIRKVTPEGAVTTVLGAAGKNGTTVGALPASLSFPTSVVVLPYGQLAVTTGGAVVVTKEATF
jgi:sugar lactone lactonase YvrE